MTKRGRLPKKGTKTRFVGRISQSAKSAALSQAVARG